MLSSYKIPIRSAIGKAKNIYFHLIGMLFSSDEWRVKYVTARVEKYLYFVPQTSIHRPACRAFLNGKYYEPETHQLIRKIYDCIPGDLVHAGTFFGDMIPSFSDSVGQEGKLYCFEPVLESYILAKQCIETNKCNNVILSNCGVSDKIGSLRIQTNGGKSGGGSSIQKDGDRYITTMPIDMFEIKNLVCIQLDVEGHELNALKGAQKTILRCNPLILIEDDNNNCKQFLHENNYINKGQIPGLKIWVKRGDERFEKII